MRFLYTVILLLLVAGCNTVAKKENREMDIAEPSPADVYRKLGVEYLGRGQYDVALENFKQALDADSRNSESHHAIGVLYQRLEQTDLAGYHLEKAVSLRSSNASAQTDYGSYLCAKGSFAEAEQHFQVALSTPLYKRPWNALVNAGVCAQRNGDYQTAEDYLRRALKMRPNLAPALLAMAKLSVDQGNPMSGRAFLQRYLAVAEPTPETMELGVRIEEELGDTRAAEEYRSQLQKQSPRDQDSGEQPAE